MGLVEKPFGLTRLYILKLICKLLSTEHAEVRKIIKENCTFKILMVNIEELFLHDIMNYINFLILFFLLLKNYYRIRVFLFNNVQIYFKTKINNWVLKGLNERQNTDDTIS